MSAPTSQEPSSAALVRLVAAREVSTRIRDKGFIISSVVILLVIVGAMVFQVLVASGDDESRVGLVGGDASVVAALEAQGEALDVDVEVVELDDEAAARTAVDDEDVDGALLAGEDPELLVRESADGELEAIVQGAVGQLAVAQQLSDAGIDGLDVPEVAVTALDANAVADQQRVVAAIFGVVILYSLLILFGQFIAQGVVEEKSSRVVELLLATMSNDRLVPSDDEMRRIGAETAEAVGVPTRGDRQEVVVAALDEGRRPRAVDVPEQDPHAATTFSMRTFSTAATTSAAPTDERQGCPGTGHTRARVPRQAASWSPSSTVGTP